VKERTADHLISRLHEITCSEASLLRHIRRCPCRTHVRPSCCKRTVSNQYHNSQTVVYKATLTFQRGSGGAAAMSTLHHLQVTKNRWQESTIFHAIRTLCDVEEGRRRRSRELPAARSGNCLCCYNQTIQWASLFVRTGLVTSLWFKFSKDRYESPTICHIAILKLSQFIWTAPEVLVPMMRKM